MTNLQFLFYGKENLIPMRVGKRCTAQHWRKPFSRIHMLLPCSHARILSALPAQHLAFQRGQWQHSKTVPSVPFHTAVRTVCWGGRKQPHQFTKHEQGTASLASAWLTRQAHCTHLTDPVSRHTVLNQKDPTANRRTHSISNLIVLNIASSLQTNGNIKPRSTGIPLSLWSRVRYGCICNR